MSELVLSPLPAAVDGDVLRQACRLHRTGGAPDGATVLWWESSTGLAPLPAGDAESFLIASLLAAMSEGRDVRVEGSVGRRLLANLEEFMVAWSRWKPATYRRVRILPDEIREEAPRPWSRTAVAAFSGGVDASHAVWRHHSRQAGHASRDIVACALVHGFDIPLEQEDKFATSVLLARESLASLGIELVPLRSNLRQILTLDWHDLHGAAIVAAMQLLKSKAGTAIIGSSDPYDQLLLPYGSNPVTDPMLATGGMDIVHDGCGWDRTEKIADIAEWTVGCGNLRVCWAGTQIDANCGRCEKCVRTRMNFLVNGLEPPARLAPPGVPMDFRVIDSESESVLQEFDQIIDAAHRAGIRDPWVAQLGRRIAWLRVRNAGLAGWRGFKKLAKRLLRRSAPAGAGLVHPPLPGASTTNGTRSLDVKR